MTNKKNEGFLNMSLDQIMSDRFGRYSKYIIQGRALPDARDGLKPVQRRILFSMNDLGLLHNRAFKKSARVVGDVIGKYHPHGDSSIYEAMVRMSQSWKINMPLVEMHGNNGSIDDDPAAAMRYTEARLEKLSELMLDGIKKNTVKFAPNFDDSEREPTVLPALIPNLLVNGAKGIAAGYATEMPPHNLGEIIDAIILKIKSPNARLETLMQSVKGPDFPTGGIVQGKNGIYEAFERGKGRIVIRSKYELNTSKTKPSIRISEIPYGVIKSKLVKQIADIEYDKKIAGIKDVRDESDRNGISIFIQLSAGADAEKILKYFLQKTDMQIYYSYNNIAIKDNAPKQMGLSDLIDAYLNHQKQVQKNAINFDLNKDTAKLEIVEGLIKVAQIVDQVIKVIRNASGKLDVVNKLISNFEFTENQAKAIAELRLYRLSKTDQSIYIEERDSLKSRIQNWKLLLENKNEFDNYLIKKLREVKKEFATERKTKIEEQMEVISISQEELINHEDAWVGISMQGYLKRFSNRAYEANELETYGLKDGDSLKYLHKINTSDKLLVFTSEGKYIFIPVHNIFESKFKDVGRHINDFVAIKPNEFIVDAIAVNDFSLLAYIVLVTKNGKGKRVKISDFKVKRYSTTYAAINLKGKDKLIGAKISNGNKQAILITKLTKAVKYSEHNISTQGTKSSGIKLINLAQDDHVTTFALVDNNDILGIVSSRGGIKRIKVNAILPMSKNTKGKSLFRFIKVNPHLAIDAKSVDTNNKVAFSYNGKGLKVVDITKANISSSEEGFTQGGPNSTISGKILKFDRIHSKSSLFENTSEKLDETQIFDAAEATINSVDEISLDDLLKDL